jgi:hypothetical protein
VKRCLAAPDASPPDSMDETASCCLWRPLEPAGGGGDMPLCGDRNEKENDCLRLALLLVETYKTRCNAGHRRDTHAVRCVIVAVSIAPSLFALPCVISSHQGRSRVRNSARARKTRREGRRKPGGKKGRRNWKPVSQRRRRRRRLQHLARISLLTRPLSSHLICQPPSS